MPVFHASTKPTNIAQKPAMKYPTLTLAKNSIPINIIRKMSAEPASPVSTTSPTGIAP